MRYALVLGATGAVVNVVLANEGYEPPEELEAVPLSDDSRVSPGWGRDENGDWIEPPAPEPQGPPPPSDDALVNLQQTVEYLQEQIDILLLESLG